MARVTVPLARAFYREASWLSFWRDLAISIALGFGLLLVAGALMAVISAANVAHGRDLGQWKDVDPAVSQWFKSLMQPDVKASCCGEADAYWADSYETDSDGNYIAIITDQRDDGPLMRRHIDVGTRISIPKHKITWGQGNPTGHGIVFIAGLSEFGEANSNTPQGFWVYCYLPPGGV